VRRAQTLLASRWHRCGKNPRLCHRARHALQLRPACAHPADGLRDSAWRIFRARYSGRYRSDICLANRGHAGHPRWTSPFRSTTKAPSQVIPCARRIFPEQPPGFVLLSADVSSSDRVDLRVQVGALRLSNPIITASGTFGYGLEFAHLVDLNQLGGLVTKGISLEPIEGAPAPR